MITKYTHHKLPAFFEFAKDKSPNQVEKRNSSFVNKLYRLIPNKKINTRSLNLGKIDPYLLMSDPRIVCPREVSALYDKLNSEYRYMINMKDENSNNLRYVSCTLRNKFTKLGYSEETITDMLVHYLYGKDKPGKQLLWFCFGKQIADNLEKNLPSPRMKAIQCVNCGKWFEVSLKDQRTTMCPDCYKEYRRNYNKELRQRIRSLSADQN